MVRLISRHGNWRLFLGAQFTTVTSGPVSPSPSFPLLLCGSHHFRLLCSASILALTVDFIPSNHHPPSKFISSLRCSVVRHSIQLHLLSKILPLSTLHKSPFKWPSHFISYRL